MYCQNNFKLLEIYEKKASPREIDVTWKHYLPQPRFNCQRRILRLSYHRILHYGELDFIIFLLYRIIEER